MGKAVEEPKLRLPEMASADSMRLDMMPGELGALLGEIEREDVPERLLELAVRLQAALQTSRVSHHDHMPGEQMQGAHTLAAG